MKVLWLASWYPNKYEPVNGDFIQRHAIAVKEFLPIDVIHVVQLGKDAEVKNNVEEKVAANLREFIYSFSFKKTQVSFIDRIRYNLHYLSFYENVLNDYISKFGKPDLVHVHVPIKAGIIARKIARKWNIPYIVSEQASYYELSAPDNFYKRSTYFRKNTARVFKNAAAVTNVSATIGEKIKQMFGLSKVYTVHNLADATHFFYKDQPSASQFTWLHVSALGEQKNIRGMFDAFSKLKEESWKLIVVGPANDSHYKLANELGLTSKIKFTGELPHRSVAEQMQKANAFVLFSKHENFPCVVVEALCCGLPVVASKVGGVAEAINPSNGLLVESENVLQLTEALQTVIENHHKYNRQQISEKAISKYNSEVIAQQFVDIYTETIAAFKK